MKRVIALSLAILCIATLLPAKNRKITNPSVDFTKVGIYHIEQVQLTNKETRLTLHCTFIPGWWIKFGRDAYIQADPSGEKLLATGIEGTEFGKETYMPESGDTTLVLIFPPIDKSVKKINFGEGETPDFFGINLDKKARPDNTKDLKSAQMIRKVKTEVESPKKSPAENPPFFRKDTARLRGYIKGYDPRAGFTTGILYIGNELTREDYPIVAQIDSDGCFKADFEINHPICTYITFRQNRIPFYIEPGETVGLILDWTEFLEADRKRNMPFIYNRIEYLGSLASLNRELNSFTLKLPDYRQLYEMGDKLDPNELLKQQIALRDENLSNLDLSAKEKSLSPKAVRILKNNILLTWASYLFDYESNRSYSARANKENAALQTPLPSDFYDFLQAIDLQNEELLISPEFSTFINRFEYCTPLSQSFYKRYVTPSISFYQYLKNIKEDHLLTPEETKHIIWLDELRFVEITPEIEAEYKKKEDFTQAIYKKVKTQLDSYRKEGIKDVSEHEKELIQWRTKDSLLVNSLHLEPNLVYEIAKVRSLNYSLKKFKKEYADIYFSTFSEGITNPFLKNEARRIYGLVFPSDEKTAYDLPEGKGTNIFRKIIDPLKGKVLFVDFWATTCGPCVGGIKNMKDTRAKYAGNPDFDFVFITDDRTSPRNDYDKFVAEQELKNIHRISADEMNYLRQLFKFNGIPRYIVINKEGKVWNDDFQMHNFEFELPKYLTKQP